MEESLSKYVLDLNYFLYRSSLYWHIVESIKKWISLSTSTPAICRQLADLLHHLVMFQWLTSLKYQTAYMAMLLSRPNY